MDTEPDDVVVGSVCVCVCRCRDNTINNRTSLADRILRRSLLARRCEAVRARGCITVQGPLCFVFAAAVVEDEIGSTEREVVFVADADAIGGWDDVARRSYVDSRPRR